MTVPIPDLAALEASTTGLLSDLDDEGWDDAAVHAPSLLPDWTRAHVLTHLARHADGVAHTLAGALRGERVARYPGGMAERSADIEKGAGRTAAELFDDVRTSAQWLDRLFDEVADADGWHLPCDQRTAGEYVLSRWCEVEVHRVDLAGRYRPFDWPPAFVSYLLPATVGDLDERIPAGHAIRIEVEPDGSVSGDLGGTVWTCGSGDEPAAVVAPDWALLAWALGRPAAVADVLPDPPQLDRWH